MNKFLLSSDELTECIESYGILSDDMLNDLEIIKKIKQQSDKESRLYDQICQIENDIKKQIRNIDALRSQLKDCLEKYAQTELDIFSHIQKRLFINVGQNSLNSIIVERECDFSESMLLENHTLRHEQWLAEFVTDINKN